MRSILAPRAKLQRSAGRDCKVPSALPHDPHEQLHLRHLLPPAACVGIATVLVAMVGCSTQSRVDPQFILISAAVTTREFADLAFPATNPLEDSSRLAAASLGQTCSVAGDHTVQVRSGVSAGLFDLREPDNVNNGTLQAALKRVDGSTERCSSEAEIVKIQIDLARGLEIRVPTSSADIRVLTADGAVWEAGSAQSQFILERVDLSLAPSRAALRRSSSWRTRRGTPRVLLVSGSFRLPEHDSNPAFFP